MQLTGWDLHPRDPQSCWQPEARGNGQISPIFSLSWAVSQAAAAGPGTGWHKRGNGRAEVGVQVPVL